MTHTMTTQAGRLTRYALSCGDVERWTHKTPVVDIHVTLWMEHGTFHVRAHSRDHGRLAWRAFRTLSEARREFDTVKRQIKNGTLY